MRIKLFVPSTYQRINIKIIKADYSRSNPRFLFTCDKKYEQLLFKEPIRFVDAHKKELFRTERTYLYLRLYETDFHIPKVIFEVRDLWFEDLGKISGEYLEKILKKACNAIKPPDDPPPPPKKRYERPSWWPQYKLEYMRYYERVFKHKIQCKYYVNHFYRYIKNLSFNEKTLVAPEDPAFIVESVAPP